jgi:imidazolonepropionase-like amidohydrolase
VASVGTTNACADYGLWRAVEEGYIEGPRVFFCGRAFSQTGGHGDVRAPGTGTDWDPCGCSPRGTLAEVVDGTNPALRLSGAPSVRPLSRERNDVDQL